MIIPIFNKDISLILTIFSASPGSKFQRKELKKITGLNNINLDNAINILLSLKLIKKENRFISLNFDNKDTTKIINLIANEYKYLRELPFNVYFSIINITHFLSRLKNVDLYLFGSYSKLIFKETSDIDLAIISDGIKNKEELKKLILKLESKYKKKMEIHYFTKKFYKNKDPLVKEILKNGIKLM